MRSSKVILALCAFFVLAAGIAGCGGSSSGGVATMAGNTISLRAYKHWMFVAAKGQSAQDPGAPVIVPTDPPKFKGCIAQVRKQIPTLAKTPDSQVRSDCSQLFTSLNTEVMDFLIKAYWYQAEAAHLHIKLTQKEIETSFTQAKAQEFKTAAAFQSFLKETGQTMQDILYRVKINALLTKLEARHATPIDATTIAAYYKAHPTQFGTPASRDIRIVRTKTQASAAAAKAALDHGQSWQVVAKKYSIDAATKNNGGLLTNVTSGEEETALNNAAFAASANKILGPIHGTFGYYVFEVTKINPGTQQTLAKATPLIKELLTSQNSQNEENAVNAQAKKQWLAQTTCTKGYAMDDCKGYKAPKATTPTATPTTTAPQGSATVTTSSTPTTSTTSGTSSKKKK